MSSAIIKSDSFNFTGQTTSASSSYTCDTNSDDDNCYCVLDAGSDTNNWFVARSQCRQNVNGDLVDVVSDSVNTFVTNLLITAK